MISRRTPFSRPATPIHPPAERRHASDAGGRRTLNRRTWPRPSQRADRFPCRCPRSTRRSPASVLRSYDCASRDVIPHHGRLPVSLDLMGHDDVAARVDDAQHLALDVVVRCGCGAGPPVRCRPHSGTDGRVNRSARRPVCPRARPLCWPPRLHPAGAPRPASARALRRHAWDRCAAHARWADSRHRQTAEEVAHVGIAGRIQRGPCR